MGSKEILNKYIDFYKERGHKLIPNVSLVPENDPTLLYVNSGMFPLVPYLSGEPHPLGKRLVNVQRAARFGEDLENVGDPTHTTVFHMIGNWSLGDYFKDEQLPWAYEFLIEVLGLDPHKMYATVFAGDSDAPRDEESVEIIKKIYAKYGIEAKENERIFARGKEDNWWKRGDAPGELGGPDSEIFYYIGTEGTGAGQDPTENQYDFLEIGNSVFMQYKKREDGGWEELSQKNVDFGGGLERIALAVQGKQDIYETDNFWPIVERTIELSGKDYYGSEEYTVAMRTLADHIRGAVFLVMDGVLPSNKDQGYILRRLLRRIVRSSRVLGIEKDISVNLVPVVTDMFAWMYPDLLDKQEQIQNIFSEEEVKFRKTLEKGSKEAEKILGDLAGVGSGAEDTLAKHAFDLYQSMGYPVEIFLEDIKDKGLNADIDEVEEVYENLLVTHRERSRAGAEQKFKGGLADTSEETVRYHTATHLLHWALRKVLGEHINQEGSNITSERLRFDFPYSETLTDNQIRTIQDLVNEKVTEKLPVGFVILPREEAERTGAISFFKEKYGDMVKVYYIGDNIESAVSKEFCGGPHVENTGDLKPLQIYKQKKLGKNILRVYARFTA